MVDGELVHGRATWLPQNSAPPPLRTRLKTLRQCGCSIVSTASGFHIT